MPTRLGYLLPTREKIMAGEPATEPLLDLAPRAERLADHVCLEIVARSNASRRFHVACVHSN